MTSTQLLPRLRLPRAQRAWVWLFALLALAALQAQTLKQAAAAPMVPVPAMLDICGSSHGAGGGAPHEGTHSHQDCCLSQGLPSLGLGEAGRTLLAAPVVVQRSRRVAAAPGVRAAPLWQPWRGRAPPQG